MNSNTTSLEYGGYYHIYNRGVDKDVLFNDDKDYFYFLKLYEKYISKVVDTYSWVLMGNHFHFSIKIKEENEIEYISEEKRFNPSRQFSHLFNTYTKYFNKRHNRIGGLYQGRFKRIIIEDESYFRYLIYYIHHNPVHHKFVDNLIGYRWSSYLDILSSKETFINYDEVIELFDDIENFKFFHENKQELDEIKDSLFE